MFIAMNRFRVAKGSEAAFAGYQPMPSKGMLSSFNIDTRPCARWLSIAAARWSVPNDVILRPCTRNRIGRRGS
jgi:hypothetical protein